MADPITVEQLVTLFEESEMTTYNARLEAERDRDYFNGAQYTAEEIEAFKKRKQPPIIINRIKRKIDFLKGFEQSQRVSPRVLPRTPAHEVEADGAEQALRYVTESQFYNKKRSRVWDNLLVEGMGGYDISVMPDKDGDFTVSIDVVPWDRIFYDPHSYAPDFSDASHLGAVKWMDYDEAMEQYPDAGDILETTMARVMTGTTYDDRPRYQLWADRQRKRVRICQVWLKRNGEWYFAEFTKGGILKAGPSPYLDDKGRTECGLILGSAYVKRDNSRYGIVREMIGPQDEINKRRSKALHLLNVNQVIAEEGAVRDVEKARREMARPDGWVNISPGYSDKINIQTRTDLATGHMQLLQEAKGEIDNMAGGVGLQSAISASGASQSAGQQNAVLSGKAIMAAQQNSVMEIAPLIDSLRDLDIRVYRAVWNRIRQFWKGEKWVRVTDDERNIKWLGLNVNPMQLQMMQMQNPQMAEKLSGVVGDVAALDIDIIVDDTPDGVTPQLEQFQSLVALKKLDAQNELPFRAILMAMPNLKNKERILAEMEQSSAPKTPQEAQKMQLQMQATQMEFQNAQYKMQEQAAKAAKTAAEAQYKQVETQLLPQKIMADIYKPITLGQQQADNDHRQRLHDFAMSEADRSHAAQMDRERGNREDRMAQRQQMMRDRERAQQFTADRARQSA